MTTPGPRSPDAGSDSPAQGVSEGPSGPPGGAAETAPSEGTATNPSTDGSPEDAKAACARPPEVDAIEDLLCEDALEDEDFAGVAGEAGSLGEPALSEETGALAAVQVDPEALFCALVLAPATFSRNKFYSLFAEENAHHARRRAAHVRSVVRHLVTGAAEAERVEIRPEAEGGGAVLWYRLAQMHVSRTSVFTPLELAVLRYALGQAAQCVKTKAGDNPLLALSDGDRRIVEEALLRLGDRLHGFPLG